MSSSQNQQREQRHYIVKISRTELKISGPIHKKDRGRTKQNRNPRPSSQLRERGNFFIKKNQQQKRRLKKKAIPHEPLGMVPMFHSKGTEQCEVNIFWKVMKTKGTILGEVGSKERAHALIIEAEVERIVKP